MKRRSLFLILGLLLPSLLYVNIKVAHSSYFQAYLMYDFNKDSYLVPYESFDTELDVNLPNLTNTVLPIKFVKARYLVKNDSLAAAKKLLYKASKDNPYIMGPEEMLASIFLEQENLDSAYFYSKKAFYNMPNVNPHRYTFFRVLQKMEKREELDTAFVKIKFRGNPAHWYDYIYTKFKLNKNDEDLIPLLTEFKEQFPGEDFSTINEINNFISIGSEAFTLSAALSLYADEKFREEKYIEAADYYEKSIDFNPNEYIYYENAAIAYDLSENYDKAIEYYDKVLNSFKTSDGRVEFYKGLMLIKTNKQKEGCEVLKISRNKNFILKTTGMSAVSIYPALCSGITNN